jgi:hypothetical protein
MFYVDDFAKRERLLKLESSRLQGLRRARGSRKRREFRIADCEFQNAAAGEASSSGDGVPIKLRITALPFKGEAMMRSVASVIGYWE